MKPRLFILLVFVLAACSLRSAEATAATHSEADAVAKSILDSVQADRPSSDLSEAEREEWIRVKGDAICARMQDFIVRYPSHPSRWQFEMTLTNVLRTFVGPGAESRKAQWLALQQDYRRELMTSPDVPRLFVQQIEYRGVLDALQSISREADAGRAPNLAAARASIDAFAAKWPEAPQLASAEVSYASLVDKNSSTGDRTLRALLQHTSPAVVKAAQARLDHEQRLAKPFELKFTAVDGRDVDIAMLRGKVVLVDFWATWCGPCIAQLPSIKRLYSTFHDKGLEIIGISLDREQDRQKLIDFTAKNDMPWPQHFDGRYWQNEFARKYGISGIPALFLIDQLGNIVTHEAHGPQLEAEVRRLLRL